MSGTTELDRMIVEWLRDGETVAPPRLAGEISSAIAATKSHASRLLRWPRAWPGRGALGVVVVALIAASLLAIGPLAGLWLPVPKASPGPVPSPSPSPRASPSENPSPRPTREVLPPTVPPMPTVTPSPTYPPARSWEVGRVKLDLPKGWGDPPGGFALVLIGALDEMHDPDAGVLAMILYPGQAEGTDSFAFHVNDPVVPDRPDAGIRVRLFATPGINASAAADQLRVALDDGGYTAIRGTLARAAGQAVVIDWDQAFNGPALHFRAVFIDAADSVIRIDLGTMGAPSKSIAAAFLSIIRSARLAPAPGTSP